uniref:Essential protein Yae1 N-terminal domain-containing protein n=1 Tax=Ananas comosus var. bracteatus TaxID=296719 RepID=A0A6V7PEN4_ANACO|nr:unnamed protein product [Ananas comosus var. bracteatus]
MEPKANDPDDFIESSVLLDETQYQEGYRDGYNDGLVSGKEEGREVGLKIGFQLGEEMGFYKGCIDVWNSVTRANPDAFSSRIKNRIEQLEKLVKGYPLLEPENEQVQEMMEKIRLKFRIISANLGVRLEYEGSPTSSTSAVQDF